MSDARYQTWSRGDINGDARGGGGGGGGISSSRRHPSPPHRRRSKSRSPSVSRSRSRSPSDSPSRSRSRSSSYERRVRERKRKRVSGWDVPPTAEQAAAAAAAALAHATANAGLPSTPMPQLNITQPAATVSGTIHPSRLGLVPGVSPSLSAPSSSSSSFPPPPAPNPAAQRQARRLYIGNLPLPITEHELRSLFNEAFPAAFPHAPPGDAVISVYLNIEKKFGFVEFRNPEEATMAMQLDGIMLRGISLRVKRPSDYIAPTGGSGGGGGGGGGQQMMMNTPAFSQQPSLPTPSPAFLQSPAIAPPPGVILTQVPDGPNKVFCGGLPYALSEPEIKELLQSFGALRAFHLVKEKDSGQSKGYCFFEYSDPNNTDVAVSGLNNLRIGERTLTVRRAQAKGADGQFGGQQQGGYGQHDAALSAGQLGALAAMRASGAIPGLSHPSSSSSQSQQPPPTRILSLSNMVTPEELLDDKEYRDILDDITIELRKYGQVLSVYIPRPSSRDHRPPQQSGVGRVFVEYNDLREAQRARAEVEGRQFANRTIRCDYVSVEQYQRREF